MVHLHVMQIRLSFLCTLIFRLYLQISLRNKAIVVGTGLTFGSSAFLQATCPSIQRVADLFVSLSAPPGQLQINFKLFLVGSFARTWF